MTQPRDPNRPRTYGFASQEEYDAYDHDGTGAVIYEGQAKILAEALRFYADPDSHTSPYNHEHDIYTDSPVVVDDGAKAREALKRAGY